MDWARAKRILIIMLLAADMILAGYWYGMTARDSAEDRAAAEGAAAFAASQGVVLETEIPQSSERLPVLFVTFGGGEAASYKGHAIEVTGSVPGQSFPKVQSAGKTRARLSSAGAALVSLLSREDIPSGATISSIELVYWVDRSLLSGEGSEDTAVPAWKFVTYAGNYYIIALN